MDFERFIRNQQGTRIEKILRADAYFCEAYRDRLTTQVETDQDLFYSAMIYFYSLYRKEITNLEELCKLEYIKDKNLLEVLAIYSSISIKPVKPEFTKQTIFYCEVVRPKLREIIKKQLKN